MSVKFRKFLAARRDRAVLENRVFDWAWVGGKYACWRPIKSYRVVTKGRKKGWIRIELFVPPGKIHTIPANHVKLANCETN